ncbi:hypothetical protein CLIB1444_06S04698 [[Candida] jaroonii]|uniref:Uncharacterized protein n=1 Tax=[Candida] jaroonii TaxID=467808 RepID=A0ACA9Y933_9ASCO|nr:hypothetical protein CLIB1444_06S04698 [[Candida] jaroonii]
MSQLIREHLQLHWTGQQSYQVKDGVELYTFESDRVRKMIKKSSCGLTFSYDDEECHEYTSEGPCCSRYSYRNKKPWFDDEVYFHEYREEPLFWAEQYEGRINGQDCRFSQFGTDDHYTYAYYWDDCLEEYTSYESEGIVTYEFVYKDIFESGIITGEESPEGHQYYHEFHNLQGSGVEGTVEEETQRILPSPERKIKLKNICILIVATLILTTIMVVHKVLLL